MHDHLDIFDEETNPLDGVEDILAGYNWTFNRMAEDELTVEVAGKFCTYKLFFIWQPDMNAMQFWAQYDVKIHAANALKASIALAHINENLWMGHFDIPKDTKTPSFRYTYLLNKSAHTIYEPLEELVDIALTQCEKFYPAFRLLSLENVANDETLPLALMETQGVS